MVFPFDSLWLPTVVRYRQTYEGRFRNHFYIGNEVGVNYQTHSKKGLRLVHGVADIGLSGR